MTPGQPLVSDRGARHTHTHRGQQRGQRAWRIEPKHRPPIAPVALHHKMNQHQDRPIQTGRHYKARRRILRLRRTAHPQQIGKNGQQQHNDQQSHDRQEIGKLPWFLAQHGFRLYRPGLRDEGKKWRLVRCGSRVVGCRFLGGCGLFLGSCRTIDLPQPTTHNPPSSFVPCPRSSNGYRNQCR